MGVRHRVEAVEKRKVALAAKPLMKAMRSRLISLFSVPIGYLILLVIPGLVCAQQQPAGVVTGVQGQVQLTRPAAPRPVALRFKDGVIIRDIVDTKEKSLARILFGGRSMVTVRELSRLVVREEILPTAARRDVYELSNGAILVNVAKQLMRPGDEVIIRTPNAVAAIRGTIVFAQYNAALNQTTVSVLTGGALVQGQLVGPNSQAVVTGTDIKVGTITPAQANQILNDSQIGGKPTFENVQTQTNIAGQLADTLVTIAGGPPPQPPQPNVTGSTRETDTTKSDFNLLNDSLQCKGSQETCNPPGDNTLQSQSSLPPPPPPPPQGPTFPLTPPSTLIVAADSLNVPGNLFELPFGQSTTQPNSLLIATNASLGIGGSGFVDSGFLTGPASDPLFKIDPSTITTGGDLFHIGSTGNMSLTAPLLTDTGGTFNIGGDLLKIEGGGTLTSSGSPALFQFDNTTVNAAKVVDLTGGTLSITGAGSNLISTSGGATKLGGPVLSMPSGTPTVGIRGDALNIASTVTGPSGGSLFSVASGNLNTGGDLVDLAPGSALNLTGSSLVTVTGTGHMAVTGDVLRIAGTGTVSNSGTPGPVISVGTGGTLIASGTFLNQSANGSVSLVSPFLNLAGGITGSGSTALMQVAGGTVSDTADLVTVSAPSTLGHPLLLVSGGTVTAPNIINVGAAATFPFSNATALMQVTGGQLSTASSLATLGSNLTLENSFFSQSGGAVSVSADALAVGANSLTTGTSIGNPSSPPVFDISSGTFTTSGDLVSVTGGNVSFRGAILDMARFRSPNVTIGGDALNISGTASALSRRDGFSVGSGNLNVTGNLVELASGSNLQLIGNLIVSLVRVGGGNGAVGGDVLKVPGTATISSFFPSGPVIEVDTGGSLTAGGAFLSKSGVGSASFMSPFLGLNGGNTGSGSTALMQVFGGTVSDSSNLVSVSASSTLGRPLLLVSGGTVTAPNIINLGAPLTTPNGQSVFQVVSGQLSATSSLATLATLGANLTLGGTFLSESDGAVSAGTDALAVGAATLTTSSSPVFSLTGGTLTTTGAGSDLVSVSGGAINLGGPLLSMPSGSPTVNISGDALNIASAVTGPSSGNLLSLASGNLAVNGNLLHLAAGSTLSSTSPNPLIQLTDSAISVGANFAALAGGSLTASGPLLKITGGSVTLGGNSLLNLTTGATVSAGGSVLDLSNLNLDLGAASVVRVSGGSTLANTAGPVIKVSGGSLKADALGIGDSTETFSFTGTLLDLTNTNVTLRTLGEDIPDLNVNNFHLSLAADEPFFRLNNSALNVTGAGNDSELISLSPSETGTPFAGLGMIASNSTVINQGGGLLRMKDSFDTTSGSPLLQISGSIVNTSSDLVEISSPTCDCTPEVTMAGQLLKATNSSISTANLLLIENNSLTALGTAPFIQIDPSAITASGDLIHIGAGASVLLMSPLISDSGSAFSIAGSFLKVADGGMLTGAASTPLIQLSGSTVNTGTQAVVLSSLTAQMPPFMVLAGPLLSATNNTHITASNPNPIGENLLFLGDSAVLMGPPKPLSGDAPALITFQDSSLTATRNVLGARRSVTPQNPTAIALGGPLLSATNSSFNLNNLVSLSESAQLVGTGTTPLVQSTSNTFITANNLFRFASEPGANTVNPGTPGPSGVALAGALLSDAGSTFDVGSRFALVDGGSTLTSTSADPLILLSGSTVNTANDFTNINGAGSKMTLSGSLLNAGSTLNIGTDPTVSGDLLDINSAGQVAMNSASPVLLFNGGTHTIGTADATTNNTPNRIARLQGDATNGIDATTGLGTFRPLSGSGVDPAPFTGAANPIGTLIKATGGAMIEVNAGDADVVGGGVSPGNAVQIDRALLEAALPIIQLIGTGTTDTTQTKLTTAGDAMDIFRSKVVSLGPVIALDNGLITVNNGPLITVRNGSNFEVTGDLLSLTNHSKINVVNGPLIRVTGTSGAGTNPAASTLNVSGALVNFGGSGGNQIVVNNSITPTATLSGLSVNTATGGSVTIGPNPVKNPALGSITVTGSLIQATNSGRVNITAP